MSAPAVAEPTTNDAPTDVRLVDCDIHPFMHPMKMTERLGEPWGAMLDRYGPRMPGAITVEHYPRTRNKGMREDAWPDDGGYPGGDPVLTQRQLLDEYGFDYGILNALHMTDNYEVPELSARQATALNDWLHEEWMQLDSRYLGAIGVSHENPRAAVAEIERRAAQGGWAQVIMPSGTQVAHGRDRYRPIYRAAAECGLPVAFHTGGFRSYIGSGWPSFYFEEHVANSAMMHSLLLSLICEGVFDDIPDLQVVLTEGGMAWSTPAIWAAQDAWQLIGDSAPRLKRSPREIMTSNVWFTTQPIEEPDDGGELVDIINDLGMMENLLFATDYPHWDFDSPTRALPRQMSKEDRAKVLGGNAARLYRLEPRVAT